MKQDSVLNSFGERVRRAFKLKPADKTVYVRNANRIASALEEMAQMNDYTMRTDFKFEDRLEWFAFIGALYVNLMLNCRAWQAKGPETVLDEFSDIATTLYVMGMDKIPGQEGNDNEAEQ